MQGTTCQSSFFLLIFCLYSCQRGFVTIVRIPGFFCRPATNCLLLEARLADHDLIKAKYIDTATTSD
jgi:hypothetical protein